MNELYTFDPRLLADYVTAREVLDFFGFSSGRFLFSFPREELGSVFLDLLKNLDGLQRKRAEVYLGQKAKELISLNINYDSGLDWMLNAVAQDELRSDLRFLMAKDMDDLFRHFYSDWQLGGSYFFEETLDEYLSILRLLPYFNSEIFIVDPFFSLRIFDLAEHNSSSPPRIASRFPNDLLMPRILSTHKLHRDKNLFLESLLTQFAEKREKFHVVIVLRELRLQSDLSGNDQIVCMEHDLSALSRKLSLSPGSLGYVLLPDSSYPHWRFVSGINAGIQLDSGISFSKRKSSKLNQARWFQGRTEVEKFIKPILELRRTAKYI
jgi:hypothetical protein